MPESNDFKELDNRIRSFANWSYLSDSSKLANAGFYATGYHDLVRCYACGLGLRYLNADDDPLSEHIKNCTSSCAFLNELAGEHQDLNAEEPDISDTEDELEQLEEQNDRLRESTTCKVCRERQAIILLLPCSHLAACVQCGSNLSICPVCSRPVVETIKTFLG
ncbi:baculoviral IAP repeat-containing protein 3-like isoform X2 [Mya arenaria]|uniref:baculoviral IAP repeat-containing protein 3-like isoform X2 n=1 Tax=Mya arenaria TaxID=6604 RepID=UPI0022E781E8|nr:baculoviral IAP repeat-containing protein 3-like isoform X2 [Mya arenaria]